MFEKAYANVLFHFSYLHTYDVCVSQTYTFSHKRVELNLYLKDILFFLKANDWQIKTPATNTGHPQSSYWSWMPKILVNL